MLDNRHRYSSYGTPVQQYGSRLAAGGQHAVMSSFARSFSGFSGTDGYTSPVMGSCRGGACRSGGLFGRFGGGGRYGGFFRRLFSWLNPFNWFRPRRNEPPPDRDEPGPGPDGPSSPPDDGPDAPDDGDSPDPPEDSSNRPGPGRRPRRDDNTPPAPPDGPGDNDGPNSPDSPSPGNRPDGGSNSNNPIQSKVREVVRLINEFRKKHGKKALKVNSDLNEAAQKYSELMARTRHFDHTGPDGSSPWSRIRRAGYDGSGAGENIGMGQRSPLDIVKAWINSPGHRANLLANVDEIGIGWKNGYWTMNTGRSNRNRNA